MTQQLIKAMAAAIDAMRKWPARKVHIFHHNDADGLSSGAILTRAFERQGFEIQCLCLEKPYPQLLEKIFERKGALHVFTDRLGGFSDACHRLAAATMIDIGKEEELIGKMNTILNEHEAA